LLGRFSDECLVIEDTVPLNCEHAFGPSFTLSGRDEERLKQILAAPKRGALEVAGWYHSHTRSEIFLSEADLAIHNRYFPKVWQVALVLRPSMFQPVRAGFFFRSRDGKIAANANGREFSLDPAVDVRIRQQAPANPGDRPLPAAMIEPPERAEVPAPSVIDLVPPTAAVAEQQPEIRLPGFLAAPPPPSRRWPWIALSGAVLIGVGVATSPAWLTSLKTALPRVTISPAGESLPAPIMSIRSLDDRGQLEIQWDRSVRAVTDATSAMLEIIDGSATTRTPLDALHLRAGTFTYIRHSGQVDVRLRIEVPGAPPVTGAISFLGALPQPQESEEAGLRKKNDDLMKEVDRLKAQLAAQTARANALRQRLIQSAPQPVGKSAGNGKPAGIE
jgi:hypothetical protein